MKNLLPFIFLPILGFAALILAILYGIEKIWLPAGVCLAAVVIISIFLVLEMQKRAILRELDNIKDIIDKISDEKK